MGPKGPLGPEGAAGVVTGVDGVALPAPVDPADVDVEALADVGVCQFPRGPVGGIGTLGWAALGPVGGKRGKGLVRSIGDRKGKPEVLVSGESDAEVY